MGLRRDDTGTVGAPRRPWALCAAALAALLGRGRRARGEAPRCLSQARKGKRALLVGAAGAAEAEAAAFGGAQVRRLPLEGAGRLDVEVVLGLRGEFDVVHVEGCLGGFPEGLSRSLFAHLCGLVAADGVLVVHDVAVLPESRLAILLQALRTALQLLLGPLLGTAQRAPHDFAAWAPGCMQLVARLPLGPRHEELTFRRRASAPAEAVERLRRLHGDTSMAYCTSPEANRIGGAERQIRHFLAAPRGAAADGSNEIGYVAYVEHVVMGARLRLVLMDPVCAAEAREATLWAFLAECEAVRARVVFACVSAGFAKPLRSFGFHTTMLGAEVGIPLAQYRLSKDNRRYLRAAAARGLECHKQCCDLEELEALNATWVANKASGAEVLIWTWPPSMPRPEAGGKEEVRRLFAYQDGRLVGFVCAEPYHRGDGSGEVLGYGLNTIRFLPRLSPPWISDFTVATLIQYLQAEAQAEYLAFGLSPWSEVQGHIGDLPWLRRLFQLLWEANVEDVYNVQGLARKKAHHCAGQGVRLDDRFVAGLPEYAVGDTARFTYLLLGDCLRKLPAALSSMARRSAGGVAGGGARRARAWLSRVVCLVQRAVGRQVAAACGAASAVRAALDAEGRRRTKTPQ